MCCIVLVLWNQNGALVTPAESILLGTVRQVVLDAAEIEGGDDFIILSLIVSVCS
jgi:branched-subunit amino acid aminotransferase/4-amino-4-deoxychorismate lyase